MTPINFENSKSNKKGNIGESIVKDWLKNRGYMIYSPEVLGAHAFDILAMKDKINLIAGDVKTKAKLNKYNGTGIDISHYKTYKKISEKHNIPFFIFFVDEQMGKIYGNFLDKLEAKVYDDVQYPFNMNEEIIIFSMKNMILVADISLDDSNKIKMLNTRNYEYGSK